MPEPLYVSKDRKRVGTIVAMRAYEAGDDQGLITEWWSSIQQPPAPEEAIAADAEMRARRECPNCAENRPLIEAVQKAVSYVSRNQPVALVAIALAWSAVDREFRRIYGDPE